MHMFKALHYSEWLIMIQPENRLVNIPMVREYPERALLTKRVIPIQRDYNYMFASIYINSCNSVCLVS